MNELENISQYFSEINKLKYEIKCKYKNVALSLFALVIIKSLCLVYLYYKIFFQSFKIVKNS